MIVGIPGTGIGGLFYLAGALWLPVRALLRRLRGESVRWTHSLGQAVLALGVLGGLWFTGALLGMLIAYAFPPVSAAPTSPYAFVAHASHLLRVASLLIRVVTLTAVLVGVQVARLVLRRGRARSHPWPR